MEYTENDLESILDRKRGEAVVITDQDKNSLRIKNEIKYENEASSSASSGSVSGSNDIDSPSQKVPSLKRKLPVNLPVNLTMNLPSPVPSPARTQSAYLQEGQQCSALDFEESAPLISLRTFDGEVFKKSESKSFEDIAREWGKRERAGRLVDMHVPGVGMMKVLKSNMYSLEEGEPSVFMKETFSKVLTAKANGEPPVKRNKVTNKIQKLFDLYRFTSHLF